MEQDISILIAMPRLEDIFFRRTVIILGEQGKDGAMGFAVTMNTGKTLNDILSQVEPDKTPDMNFPILLGGPVKTDFFWVIHAPTNLDFKTTLKLYDNMHITSGHEIIPVYLREPGIEIFEIGIGYSGWDKEQLEEEIKAGSWWETSIQAKKIFELPVEDRWEKAFKNLGVNIHSFYDNPYDQAIN